MKVIIQVQLFSCFWEGGGYTAFLRYETPPAEDKPDLYYWAEITGQHTQTLNI